MSERWIRASEIGEYVYCRRAWWFKHLRRLQPGDARRLQQGQRHHHQHSGQLRQAAWLRRFAYVLLFCAVAFLVFQLLMAW